MDGKNMMFGMAMTAAVVLGVSGCIGSAVAIVSISIVVAVLVMLAGAISEQDSHTSRNRR